MQPLQNCIGPTIRIGRESWCLPYAGFLARGLVLSFLCVQNNIKYHYVLVVSLTTNSITNPFNTPLANLPGLVSFELCEIPGHRAKNSETNR